MKYLKKFNEELSPELLRRAGNAAMDRSKPQEVRATKFKRAADDLDKETESKSKKDHADAIKPIINNLFGGNLVGANIHLHSDTSISKLQIQIGIHKKEDDRYYDKHIVIAWNDGARIPIEGLKVSETQFEKNGNIPATPTKQASIDEYPVKRGDALKLHKLLNYLKNSEEPFSVDDWTIIGVHTD